MKISSFRSGAFALALCAMLSSTANADNQSGATLPDNNPPAVQPGDGMGPPPPPTGGPNDMQGSGTNMQQPAPDMNGGNLQPLPAGPGGTPAPDNGMPPPPDQNGNNMMPNQGMQGAGQQGGGPGGMMQPPPDQNSNNMMPNQGMQGGGQMPPNGPMGGPGGMSAPSQGAPGGPGGMGAPGQGGGMGAPGQGGPGGGR